MKFRLSTCLLIVTVVALCVGWYCDRQRLAQQNLRLNAECAELFQSQTEVIDVTTDPWPLHRTGRVSRKILFDATDPADRARYYAKQPSKLMSASSGTRQAFRAPQSDVETSSRKP